MKIRFQPYYFLAFLILFITEVLIAVFLKDGFIRFTVGDFLVVILLYCFFGSFLKIKSLHNAIGTLAIAFGIEFLQLANILTYLNLNTNKWVNLIMGNHFSIQDLLAYTLGVIFIYLIDNQLFLIKFGIEFRFNDSGKMRW